MKRLVRALWAGEMPLAETFWAYAIAFGFAINLATTLVFMWLLTVDTSTLVLILAYALPIPYNVFMLVAVWRSAGRYQGPRIWAELARIAIVLWTIAASAA